MTIDKSKTWQEIIQMMEDDVDEMCEKAPDEVLNMFYYNIIPSGMGQERQHYNGYPFVHGGMRMLGYYTIPNIYRMADSDLFNMEHLRWEIKKIKIETEFLGYCGLPKTELYGDYLIWLSDEIEDKMIFRDLCGAYALYLEFVNSWMQHYYPWAIGCSNFRKSPEELKELARAIDKVYPVFDQSK